MHVPAHYITHIGALLQDMAVEPKVWLDSCKASHALLCDDSLWIPKEQYEQLMQQAVAIAPQPDIGLQLGNRLGIGSHGLLGYGLLNCEDLAQAARLLDRYLVTRTPFIRTAIHEQPNSFDIEIGSNFMDPAVHRSFCEVVLVTLANLFTMVSGQSNMNNIIKAVHFDVAQPEYHKNISRYLPVPHVFEQDSCVIRLEKAWLHNHFSQADAIALKQLTQQFEQQLSQIRGTQQRDYTSMVISVLEQDSQHIPSIATVANLLSVTPRTLHRRLQDEGTQFRSLLVATKKAQAEKYLVESNMPVEQVAWALGYEDVANFRRAFKTWSNMTPIEFRNKYRNRHRSQE
ncbi:AraC family transcriptional regulator [Planctobacterium marinum]|uniref:Ornithine utilization regulator n=1 Tax=Planctobacterium marinum TaxID=1631968 RepID=A0AA48HI56_9ALTE|nr:ornithine utilization regulator [Planctobacterium marinum]